MQVLIKTSGFLYSWVTDVFLSVVQYLNHRLQNKFIYANQIWIRIFQSDCSEFVSGVSLLQEGAQWLTG
jgi:hypothetical protein